MKNKENKKLIIFGYGDCFNKFCIDYPEMLDGVELILDNDVTEKDVFSINNLQIPVMHPKHIREYDIKSYAILFCSIYSDEMEAQLESYGCIDYERYYYPEKGERGAIRKRIIEPLRNMLMQREIVDSFLGGVGCESWRALETALLDKKLLIIPRMPIVLTSVCNLKCKECNNLMWHFHSQGDLDIDKILESLENILSVVDALPVCELIGGEPFLSKNISKVLEFLINAEKVFSIEITTNGTVLEVSQELISIMRNHKVVVRISDYGDTINQDKFIQLMDCNNIKYEKIGTGKRWISSGGVEKRKRLEDELRKQYDICVASIKCKTLWENRIFSCARAASLYALGYLKESGQLIHKGMDLKKELHDFILSPDYEICDYCDKGTKYAKIVLPAEQLSKDLITGRRLDGK